MIQLTFFHYDWRAWRSRLSQALTLSIFIMLVPIRALCETDGDSNWFSEVSIQTKLDKISGTKQYNNNKLSLLINGVNSNQQRIKNIQESNYIFIKTFEFRDDETGRAYVRLLLAKAQAGAKIFIQFDVKGTRDTFQEQKAICSGEENPIPPMLQTLAKSANGNVFIIPTSTPFSDWDYLGAVLGLPIPNDHEKYLITWNSNDVSAPVKVILGGLNIGDEYMFGGVKDPNGHFKIAPRYNNFGFRDTDVEMIGPINQEIVERYIKTASLQLTNQNKYFQKHIKETLINALSTLNATYNSMRVNSVNAFPENIGNSKVRFITVNSVAADSHSERNIEHVITFLMDAIPAKNTIEIATLFFLPTHKIDAAIIAAANRGITFKMLLNSTDAVDSAFSLLANAAQCRCRYLMSNASDNSIQLYEWHGSKVMGVSSIHQKLYLFGKNKTDPFIIGSSNLDSNSLTYDSEDVLLIQDPHLKEQIDLMIDNDFNQSEVKRIRESELENQLFFHELYQCFYGSLLRNLL